PAVDPKFQLTSLRLRCALKLLPTKIDIDVRTKLLLQQLQRVQGDVNVALSDVEIYALEFLGANGSVTRLPVGICIRFFGPGKNHLVLARCQFFGHDTFKSETLRYRDFTV